MFSDLCTVLRILCAVISVLYTVFSELCSVNSVFCTLLSVLYTVFSVLCAVSSVLCTVFIVLCAVNCVVHLVQCFEPNSVSYCCHVDLHSLARLCKYNNKQLIQMAASSTFQSAFMEMFVS